MTGKIDVDKILMLFPNNESGRDQIRNHLVGLGVPVILPIINYLKKESEQIFTSINQAIKDFKKESNIQPFIQIISDFYSYIRQDLCWVLNIIGKPALEPLIETLNDPDPYIRLIAVRALNSIEDKRAINHLIPLLNDEYWFIRDETAKTLGYTQSEGLIKLLTESLENEVDLDVRTTIEKAIQDIKDPYLQKELGLNWQQVQWRRQEIIAIAFVKIGSEAIEALKSINNLSEDQKFIELSSKTLCMIRNRINKNKFREMINSPELKDQIIGAYDLRQFSKSESLQALVKIYTSKFNLSIEEQKRILNMGIPVLEPLYQVLIEPDKKEIFDAIRTLQYIVEDEKKLHSGIDLLEIPNLYIQRLAAGTLGKSRNNQIVEPLVKCILNPDNEIRENAINSLINANITYVDPLFPLLDHKDYMILGAAFRILSNLRNESVVIFLIPKLSNSKWHKHLLICDILRHMGEIAVNQLIVSLKSPDWMIRSGAAEILTYIKNKYTFQPLSELLSDPDSYVRLCAAHALISIDSIVSKPLIKSYLRTESDEYTRNLIQNLM